MYAAGLAEAASDKPPPPRRRMTEKEHIRAYTNTDNTSDPGPFQEPFQEPFQKPFEGSLEESFQEQCQEPRQKSFQEPFQESLSWRTTEQDGSLVDRGGCAPGWGVGEDGGRRWKNVGEEGLGKRERGRGKEKDKMEEEEDAAWLVRWSEGLDFDRQANL